MLDLHGVSIVPLVSYGRSGSTVFMKALKALGCSVHGGAPYEDRTCQMALLSHLAGLGGLSSIHDSALSVGDVLAKNAFFNSHLISVGSSPFVEFFPHFSAFAKQLAETGTSLIAEKFIGVDLLQASVGFLPNGQLRPILLQRDPRDIFLSVKGFNAKRGYRSFNDVGDDEMLFRIICAFARQLQVISSNLESCLVFYEDLVKSPSVVIDSIARFLGVESSADLIAETVSAIQPRSESDLQHMTSNSISSTVKRWETQASPEYRAIFEKHDDKLSSISRYV